MGCLSSKTNLLYIVPPLIFLSKSSGTRELFSYPLNAILSVPSRKLLYEPESPSPPK